MPPPKGYRRKVKKKTRKTSRKLENKKHRND
jgi:hypothetical protein